MNITTHSLHWTNLHPKVTENHKKVYTHFEIPVNYTHQNIDLNGHTNWNLRPDLKHPVSMTQTGSGTGNKISRIVAWTFLTKKEQKEWKKN